MTDKNVIVVSEDLIILALTGPVSMDDLDQMKSLFDDQFPDLRNKILIIGSKAGGWAILDIRRNHFEQAEDLASRILEALDEKERGGAVHPMEVSNHLDGVFHQRSAGGPDDPPVGSGGVDGLVGEPDQSRGHPPSASTGTTKSNSPA